MAKSHASKRSASAPRIEKTYLSADERRAKGKALRDAVPRVWHAGWKAPKNRRDPVELLSESNVGRLEALIPKGAALTAMSAFAESNGRDGSTGPAYQRSAARIEPITCA